MNLTLRGSALRTRLGNRTVIVLLALYLALWMPGWTGRAFAGVDGDISLNSYVSSSSCTSTNCAISSTGMTNKGSGVGLYVRADNGDGLYGFSLAGGSGVIGWSNTANGVEGHGGNGLLGIGTENGVQAQGGTFGVFAEGEDYGVYSRAPNYGVYGQATTTTGVGVAAAASAPNSMALTVSGKAQFSRSGVASVAGTAATPKNSVRVTIPITAKSMMTATLQKFVSGTYVVAAVPNVAGGYFTIYLNKQVTTTVGPIAWQVIERS